MAHRMALIPVLGDPDAEAASWDDSRFGAFPLAGQQSNEFLDFLTWHGLTGFWLDWCRRQGLLDSLVPGAAERMQELDLAARASFLLQTHAMRQITQDFDEREILHLVFKGVATRMELYRVPHVRSASDIDLLINRADRGVVSEVLKSRGFVLAGDNASAHEETWQRGSVDIDLHWDVLAPGRTRYAMVPSLLEGRIRVSAGWRMSDEDTVAMMLLHPAVTKYVCSRHAGLNRVADIVHFVRHRTMDPELVAQRIRSTGLVGAAWATLTWLDLLLKPWPSNPEQAFLHSLRESLQLGRLRAAYLRRWIANDWPGRLEGRADGLVRIGFTLPFHDSLADVIRASTSRLGRNAGTGEPR